MLLKRGPNDSYKKIDKLLSLKMSIIVYLFRTGFSSEMIVVNFVHKNFKK